jgi:hypothetical protein
MNQPLRLFLSTLLALMIAFAFNFFFFKLSERPFTDQIFLIVFSAAALGYLIFWLGRTVLVVEKTPLFSKIDFSKVSIPLIFRKNMPGMILTLLFFAIYLSIGLRLNKLDIDTTDNFLDADNYSWMTRISVPDGSSLEMRGPHPFAYFIFRPLGWLLNLFTHNPALSAILLNTFTGASCVFMAWLFIRRQVQDSIYALLVASLLGLSTSHIFFGSVVETYIFSAAMLIGFVLVMQNRADSMLAPVIVSVITFGITVTNFVQNFIVFLVSRPRFKEIFRFTALTISLGILISIIHAAWFPSSKLFFLLSDAQTEDEYTFSIFQDPAWKVVGRVLLLIRTIFLYTVIAPRPYVFTKEVGGTFPRFNFFKIAPETFSYSSYDGLGNILVLVWAVVLLISGLFFLRNLVRTRKANLSLAFILCILFNFVLHLNYGYEPFLYSPDWAYALIFFVALSLVPLANNRLFQGGTLFFLILLAYNQFLFFKLIFDTTAIFFSRGG